MSDDVFALVLDRIERVESRVEHVQTAIPPMAQALSLIGSQVLSIDGQVQTLLEWQDDARKTLDSLAGEFRQYVDDYRRRTELQLAETRIVKVRQELIQRFGHHDEIRRRVTGILQATDLSLVRQETIRTTAEEMMLGVPRYWLGPALIALMAWIVDEPEIADRALAESLRRDDYKTGLFMTLVCRRAGRWEAMVHWLARYLLLLDPFAVDREVVVVLDAVATGTLGKKAQEVFLDISLQWAETLRQVPGQAEEQARRWVEVLDADRGAVRPDELRLLREHSGTWPRLEASLANVRRNRRVVERFQRILRNPTVLADSLADAIDDLLDSLVSRFDDEELPLRWEEHLLQLIIDEEGDRQTAEAKMQVEHQAFAEKVSFVARLTDALMHPEQAGATRAAQRFAAAFSRDSILAAHRFLVQRDLREAVDEVELSIRDWRGTSRDGGNGRELADSVHDCYTARARRELAKIKLPAYAWMAPSIGTVFAAIWLAGAASAALALGALATGLLLFALGKRRQMKAREAHAALLAREQQEVFRTVQECLAELAAYRQAWAAAHAEAGEVESLLNSLTVADSLYCGPEELPPALAAGEEEGGSAAWETFSQRFRPAAPFAGTDAVSDDPLHWERMEIRTIEDERAEESGLVASFAPGSEEGPKPEALAKVREARLARAFAAWDPVPSAGPSGP
jgi:hypothetical protein